LGTRNPVEIPLISLDPPHRFRPREKSSCVWEPKITGPSHPRLLSEVAAPDLLGPDDATPSPSRLATKATRRSTTPSRRPLHHTASPSKRCRGATPPCRHPLV
jgi:hypothetical protein